MMRITFLIAVLIVARSLPVWAEQVFTNKDLLKYEGESGIVDEETFRRLQEAREKEDTSLGQWLQEQEIERLRQKAKEEKAEIQRLELQLQAERERREKAEDDRIIIIPRKKIRIDRLPK